MAAPAIVLGAVRHNNAFVRDRLRTRCPLCRADIPRKGAQAHHQDTLDRAVAEIASVLPDADRVDYHDRVRCWEGKDRLVCQYY